MKIIVLLINVIFLGVIGISAQISFQAIPQKKEVGIDEPIRIQFILTIKGKDVRDVGNIKLPAFTNTQVIGKQIIQNQTYEDGISTIEYGNEISLRPVKSGSIKIGSASVIINGKVYSTKPLTIIVSGYANNHEERGFPAKIGETFLAFKISDKNPYQNEGVIAKLKFYTKRLELLNSITNLTPPNFQGLFVQPIKERNNTYEQEIINGETYLSRTISSYVIFPSKPGVIVINPFILTIAVPSGFFDEQEVNIKSAPITLQVKKLPAKPPVDFYGVVGSYKINITPSKTHLKADESTTINVEVSGNGNIGLIKSPDLIVSEGIESFTPKEKMESYPGSEGVIGKLSSSTVLVPHRGGQFTIKVSPFSYFDPQTGTYRKIIPDPVILTVTGDSLKGERDSINDLKNKNIKDPLSFIPSIKVSDTLSDVLDGKQKTLDWILLAIMAIVIIIIICIIYLRFIKNNSKTKKETSIKGEKNVNFEKLDKQNKPKTNHIIEQNKDDLNSRLFTLKKMAEKNENKEEFYNLVEFLLQKAVRNNLDLKEDQFLTTSEIEEQLANKFGDEFSDEYKNLLLKSQIERYSSISEEDCLEEVYLRVEKLINKLM